MFYCINCFLLFFWKEQKMTDPKHMNGSVCFVKIEPWDIKVEEMANHASYVKILKFCCIINEDHTFSWL